MWAEDKSKRFWDIKKDATYNVSATCRADTDTHLCGVRINGDWHGDVPPEEVLNKMAIEGY